MSAICDYIAPGADVSVSSTPTLRHAHQTALRHHWTWKLAFVFEHMPPLRHHRGYKILLEVNNSSYQFIICAIIHELDFTFEISMTMVFILEPGRLFSNSRCAAHPSVGGGDGVQRVPALQSDCARHAKHTRPVPRSAIRQCHDMVVQHRCVDGP